MSQIQINDQAVEPNQYFTILKGSFKKSVSKNLEKQLLYVAEQLVAAKEAGQDNFMHRLAFTYKTLIKEQELLARGYDTYVYKQDIQNFIDNINPTNSVKIIELSRYPRAIPTKVLKKIKKIKSYDLFDEFCVVFTDFTDQTHRTKKDEELIRRNRDPIIFGYFTHEGTGLKHDRFYFITDWEDQHCDLTFSKLLDKMGAEYEYKIDVNHEYLSQLVDDTYTDMERQDRTQGFFSTVGEIEVDSESTEKRLKKKWWKIW